MRMVEKMARAQYYATPRNKPFEQLSAAKRITAMKEARAAMEAMREPDDAMIKAGVEFALSATVSGDGGWPRYVADKHRAMIDKAIQESGE